MQGFTVVDLGSQAHAVARHVEGWPKSKILTWLEEYGEIVYVPYHSRPGIDHYGFLSHCSIGSGFWFERDKLVLQERIKNAIHFVDVRCATE